MNGLPPDVAKAVADLARRDVLAGLGVLDTENDPDFDRLTGLAAALFDAPIALVSLVDLDRQWFKSCFGFGERETAIEASFCAHAIASADEVMVVDDARDDPRFAGNPLVIGEPGIRFYAGAAIVVDGFKIGTLCVIDDKPRARPDAALVGRLRDLAALTASLFAFKDNSRRANLAEAALLRVEKRHKLALEAATIASWVWDLNTGYVECDPLLPELFALPSSTRLKARRLFFAIDRRDLRGTDEALISAIETEADYAGEYRVRGASPTRWLATRGRVIERDAQGRPVTVIGVSYDISDRKWNEESQRLLLRELNHRVKNTLATVQALASQTVRHAQEPREFLDAFSARLQSLGRAHGLLSDQEWRGMGLKELIELQVQPFDDPDGSRIHIAGPDAWLPPDAAVALALVLHELASNAMKYGALSVPDGSVSITWTTSSADAAGNVMLRWTESGGPTVSEPSRKGFGSILIKRSLDKVLASNVRHEFLPDGVQAEISLPLEAGLAS